jgi:hypothetical protein
MNLINLVGFFILQIESEMLLWLGELMLVTRQGTKLYTNYLKHCNFVLLDWVDELVETEERVRWYGRFTSM